MIRYVVTHMVHIHIFQYHPDVTGSNEISSQKFIEVKEAYDVLRDEQKKREYDQCMNSQRTYNQDWQHQYGRGFNHQRPWHQHSQYSREEFERVTVIF